MNYYNENDRYAAAWLRELIADGQIPKGEVDERSIVDVQSTDLTGFTQCHFFAGVGGWSYALRLAGWGDDSPVWTGSCPCQPFSSAGKGKGVADERHLWPQFFRLIGQCRPDVVFGEQVASRAGLAWLDGICDDLEGAFYSVWACDTCAAGVGAPHIRQRLWWVANAEYTKRGAEQEQYSDAHGRDGLGGSGNVSGVVFSNSPRPQQGSEAAAPNRHRDSPDSTGGDGDGLGDTTPLRRQSVAANRCEHGERDQASELPCFAGDRCVYGGLGLAESEQERIPGFAWRQSEPIPCSDGKSRRVESGTFPLVARLSETVVPSGDPSLSYVQATAEGRAMRLRGYGNAIVPPLAAEFIMAYMETSLKAEGGGWRLGEAVLAKAAYNRGREWKHGGKRF